MARKTVDVELVKEKVNHYLSESRFTTNEMRAGAASVLELILHETGNYKGFRYLDGWPCDDETRKEYF